MIALSIQSNWNELNHTIIIIISEGMTPKKNNDDDN